MNWLFKELLVIALGEKEQLNALPSEFEWKEAYKQAEKHALIGILFIAIEKLNKEDKSLMPPMPLFHQWMGEALQIETRNKTLDVAAKHLNRLFEAGKLRCCVLKGQGVARLYPIPERRQPGDIDLWVEGGRVIVLNFLRNNCIGVGQVVLHHVDARIIDGVETEIHFIPVYAYNPFLHYKVQRFFHKYKDTQFSNFDKGLGFSYPTLSFNAVYILAHIYLHFLYEGIGLRQIIDYYYVLRNMSSDERELARNNIKEIDLCKFAGAVAFMLENVCGMDKSLSVAQTDKKRGTILLEEILMSGNFGKYDGRLSGRDEKNLISFNLVALKRQLRFFRYYPMDIMSIPFFKVWHWCWRKWNGYL